MKPLEASLYLKHITHIWFVIVTCFSFSVSAQVEFHISSLPPNTPDSARIYITGSFNDWQPAEEEYQLIQTNGKYTISLPNDSVDFEYKFTRGSWLSVESDLNYLPRPNRRFVAAEKDRQISIEIANWQELDRGVGINLYTYTLIVCLLYCLFFVVGIQYVVRRPNDIYTVFLAFLPVILMVFAGRIFSTVDAYNWQPILENVSHWVVLVSALSSVLIVYWIGKRNYFRVPSYVFYAFGLLSLPVIILNIMDMVPKYWLSMHAGSFQIPIYRSIITTIVLLIILGSFFKKRFLFKGYSGLLYVIGTVLILLSFWNGLLVWKYWNQSDFLVSIENYVHVAIVLWGLMLLVSVVYVFTPNIKLREASKRKPLGELGSYKKRLEEVMQNQKAYRNPNLDLDLLAEQMDVNRNTLSKVINEGYGMNFFDFVNKARIEEFVNFVLTDNYHNYTYQYLAEKVGFNSKSSFNRAFKKFKGMTPRDYFKALKEK